MKYNKTEQKLIDQLMIGTENEEVSNGSSLIISQVIGKDKKKKAAKAAKKQRKHIAKYGVRKGCKNAKRFKK